eukprot:GHRQ01019280.1.p1 GENE.GHRQ01019280.1~~GHRQ01019280.1.p1  ORF type:complete len:192 (-),score=9.44 GHRQ01019280.1:70-645(-)
MRHEQTAAALRQPAGKGAELLCMHSMQSKLHFVFHPAMPCTAISCVDCFLAQVCAKHGVQHSQCKQLHPASTPPSTRHTAEQQLPPPPPKTTTHIVLINWQALTVAKHFLLSLLQAHKCAVVLLPRQLDDGLAVKGAARQLAQDVGGRCHAKDRRGSAQHWDGAHTEVGHNLCSVVTAHGSQRLTRRLQTR